MKKRSCEEQLPNDICYSHSHFTSLVPPLYGACEDFRCPPYILEQYLLEFEHLKGYTEQLQASCWLYPGWTWSVKEEQSSGAPDGEKAEITAAELNL